MSKIKKDKFVFKPYTPKELRDLYGISYKTFVKWIQPFEARLGKAIGGLYNEKQVTFLVNKVGYPYRVVEE
jgi:transposase